MDDRTRLMETIMFEVERMTGPEADALYRELGETIVRKLEGDRYKGNHAVALGAACRLVLSLIDSMGATAGQRARLKAVAIGLIKSEWDADKADPAIRSRKNT